MRRTPFQKQYLRLNQYKDKLTDRQIIKLANLIKRERRSFTANSIILLAQFCKEEKQDFDRKAWFAYIEGRLESYLVNSNELPEDK